MTCGSARPHAPLASDIDTGLEWCLAKLACTMFFLFLSASNVFLYLLLGAAVWSVSSPLVWVDLFIIGLCVSLLDEANPSSKPMRSLSR